MNKAKQLLFVFSTMVCFLFGCANQQQYEAVKPISLASTNEADAMLIAEDVLVGMHFTIDKADPQLGLIRTRPLPAAQFFEFWRSDNVGAFSAAEANLHTIRRIAELNFSQQEGKLNIDCEVRIQRLSLPEYQTTGNSQGYAMFSESTRSIQRLKLREEQKEGMAWIDLGSDTRLATEILKRIEKRGATQ